MTNFTESNPAPNRVATADEVQYAIQMLHTLGETQLIKMMAHNQPDDTHGYVPKVVTDFQLLNDELVLLVPPGKYIMPKAALETPRKIIGLPGKTHLLSAWTTGLPPVVKQRATLVLADAEPREVPNLDTLQTNIVNVLPAHFTKFAHLNIDAMQHTVLEFTFEEGSSLSSHLFDCVCSEGVEGTWPPVRFGELVIGHLPPMAQAMATSQTPWNARWIG